MTWNVSPIHMAAYNTVPCGYGSASLRRASSSSMLSDLLFFLKYRVKLIQNPLICVSSHLDPILVVLFLHCYSVVQASTCPPSTFPTPTGRWGVSTRSRMFARNASDTFSSLFRIRILMDPDLDTIASQFGDTHFYIFYKCNFHKWWYVHVFEPLAGYRYPVLRISDLGSSAFWPLDPGSGMGVKSGSGSGIKTRIIYARGVKSLWYGSGIRDKHPGSATLPVPIEMKFYPVRYFFFKIEKKKLKKETEEMGILNFCFSLNRLDVNGTRDNRISRKLSTRQSRTHSTV